VGIKNAIKKAEKKQKKQAKANNTPLLSSSGGESQHYVLRSITRDGFFKPVRRRAMKRRMVYGSLILKKLTRNRVLVTNKKTGDRKVLSGDLKHGITFMNN